MMHLSTDITDVERILTDEFLIKIKNLEGDFALKDDDCYQ